VSGVVPTQPCRELDGQKQSVGEVVGPFWVRAAA